MHRKKRIPAGLKCWFAAMVILVGAAPALGVGEQEPAIVLWSLPVHAELPADDPVVGVVAYHLNGIERVDFLHNGQVVATATDETMSPVTGEIEFVGRLQGLDLDPGQDLRLTARVHPTADMGVVTDVPERLFHVANPGSVSEWHVDPVAGDDSLGDGSAGNPVQTIDKALALAAGGDRVLLHDGAHALTLGTSHPFDRFVTIRPAPGAEPRITSVGNPRCGMLKLEDLWFDWRGKNTSTVFGAYSAPHYWFKGCRFIGDEGRFDNYTRTLKFWGSVTHVTVEGCEFRYLNHAVVSPTDSIIRGNLVHDLTSDAFNYSSRNLLTGNTITGLKAPYTYIVSQATEPFDFTGAATLDVHHMETSTWHIYTVDFGELADPSQATAAQVASVMNQAFAAQKPATEFGLEAEPVDGAVKVTCLRTNYTQHLYFTGAANGVLQYAADSLENELTGSGQHADVFQSWGELKTDIIIRNNRAYDNSAQQWLVQDDLMRNVAFYNNLLDAYYETYWSVMFSGGHQNFVIEFNTIWNSTSSIILRDSVFDSGDNRNFVIRNNILGIGTGLSGLPPSDAFYTDYNVYDYYRSDAPNRGPHSLETNPDDLHPTQSGLFAYVQTRVNDSGSIDYYAPDGDFSPGADSPVVDIASNASGIDYDLAWNPRDANPDIGAFEYVSTARISGWAIATEHAGTGIIIPADDGYIASSAGSPGSLRIEFASPLDPATVTPSVVAVTGQVSGDVSPLVSGVTLDGDSTLVITFGEPLPTAERYTVAIADSLHAAGGEPLGGDLDLTFGVLVGDVDASGTVTEADVVAVRQAAGQPLDPTTARYDIDGSGEITGADMRTVKTHQGEQLP